MPCTGPFTAVVGPEKKMDCGPPHHQFSSHDGPLNDQLGPQMTKQGPLEANKGPKEYLLVALWAPGKNFGGLDKSL